MSDNGDDSAKLTDSEPDNPFEIAAQIVKGPISVSTLVNSSVVLEALVIGKPEPTIRWLKGVSLIKQLSLSLSFSTVFHDVRHI
jgi:hypothetical protein